MLIAKIRALKKEEQDLRTALNELLASEADLVARRKMLRELILSAKNYILFNKSSVLSLLSAANPVDMNQLITSIDELETSKPEHQSQIFPSKVQIDAAEDLSSDDISSMD
jgi:hypothetical protein